LSFSFSTAADAATLAYDYATSDKGGTADLFVDGKLARSLSFQGSSGTGHAPAFGASVALPLGGAGSHTFELRNGKGLAYVDRICVTEGSSQAQPQTSPGKTSTATDRLEPVGELLEKVVVPAGAKAVSVLAESTTVSVPYKVAVLGPAGTVLATATSSAAGIASLDVRVSATGIYAVRLVDLGVGPVEVWSAVTPQLGG
jgi:hypothetical protein